jgi:ribonucleoside-triphosphate reductase
MSLAELAPDAAAAHLSLVPDAPAALSADSPSITARLGLTDLQRDAIGLFLAGVIDDTTFIATVGEPVWGPIGEEVFRRTYARELADDDGKLTGAKETWAATVRRVVTGNLAYATVESQLEDEAINLFGLIYFHKAVPAGRHLWVTGTKVNRFSRNCWVSGWSRRLGDHFRFLAARLFEGGGVGANYSEDLLATTPVLVGTVRARFTASPDHADFEAIKAAAGDAFIHPNSPAMLDPGWRRVLVEDCREGWTNLYGEVIDLATVADDHRLLVDVSEVRPYGTELKTFGGTASGPAPLISAIVGITGVLNGAAASGRRIGGLEAMEIDHQIACSVVAGGARRSARIAAMHWSDPEIFDFINCKADQASHWSANISIEVDRAFDEALDAGDPHALAVLLQVSIGMAANGEPGFIDTEFASADEPGSLRICNPCGEIFLATADYFGSADAAGESCNLGSVNLEAFGTDDTAATAAFELLARFLYRSTENRHADPAAWQVEARNRRIGVGIMGMQGWTAAHGVKLTDFASSTELRDKFDLFRTVVRTAADGLADALGTPRPVKVTAVAPTGSIAQMPGITPGIHPVFARRFIRRVRFADSDRGWQEARDQGYTVVDDIYAARTKVVEYPVEDAIIGRYDEALIEQSDEVSFDQFFELVAAVQATFCGAGDGNAVSATASIPVGSNPGDLAESIRGFLGQVKGITAFPDKSRDLAPYERLTRYEFQTLVQNGATIATGGDSNDGECGPNGCPIR